jgi:hypothetical protein
MRLGGPLIVVASFAALFTLGCKQDSEAAEPEYNPVIDPANFVTAVTNPLFPLLSGRTFVYVSGADSNEVEVTHQTRVVMGVTCVVVRDRDWENRELREETYDWYAQDKPGDVWYFGENSLQYENGAVVSTEGSWEAGEDEAKPGIIMKANRQIGESYRQEFKEGEAEDMAEIVSLTDTVTVAYGHFENCLRTREWSPLEPGVTEYKFYASGVGLVKTLEGSEVFSLVTIRTDTSAASH